MRAPPAIGTTISAPAFCATPRNPPSCVLVSRNSSIAATPASGRNDASGVGTGENVLVSCIIIATTIFRRAMWPVLSPRVPAAATPQSYTRAARLDRVAPAAHSRRRFAQGEIVMQLKGKPAVTLKAGQTFYEGPTDVHAVGRNVSNTQPARFLVVLLKAKGAPVLTPVKE